MADVEKYSHKIVKKLRFRIPDVPGALGTLALALGIEGVTLGDITKIHLTSNYIVRDIIAFFDDEKHFHKAVAAVKILKGYKILNIQDEVLNLHRGGKIEVRPRVKVETLNDLRMIYTPGVAQVCNYIVANPAAARDYTSIGNTVCIATNGSAVLGLGNIGVLAAMPVMEGKSIILNKMGKVSCVPLLVHSDDADEIVNALACIAETFSVIMIEDVGAPLCFEVEQKLQKRVKVPVFHDDQHGTATVILAALIKALKMTGKRKENVEIVINGAGAAGIAAAKLMLGYGFKHIVFCDRAGAIYKGRTGDMNAYKKEIACITNKRREKGALKDIMKGKDIFIGLSAPGLVNKEMVKAMNRRPIIFALANPVPEIWPKEAEEAGASIALDGRTINNALAFPGIIRGALDSRAREITTGMKFAAAETIASLAGKNEVVPNFMNTAVHEKVARAVAFAAGKKRVC
ncbi:MAG: malic enzyme-like NAD(P)-binding protein [Candidatus Omnitrophota bacterium]